MLPLALRQGFDTMVTGRPGPVNLDIPYNVFQEEADVELPPRSHVGRAHRPGASDADIAAALDLLAAARQPVLFIGHGATLSEAGPEISAAGAAARRAGDHVAQRHGLHPGRRPAGARLHRPQRRLPRQSSGPLRRPGDHARHALRRPQLVELACRATRGTFRRRKLLHVDIDPQELGRNYPPTLGVIADAKTFVQQLLRALPSRADIAAPRYAPWREQVQGWQAEWERFVRPHFGDSTSPLRPEFVVGTLQKLLPDDVILALDSGVHHNWFMQFWQARRPQSMLNSWGYSSMGFGVCGILGAQLAAPDRPCVAVVGDGGFTMAPYVLCTAVEYSLPVVWVIWNNFAWAAIRDLQYGLFDGREIGTAFYKGGSGERYNPDFAAWARACGADGVTVTRSQDLGAARSSRR